MIDYEKGRKDAETGFFIWFCRYDTSIKSLRNWLRSQKFSKEYSDGYISYMKEYSQLNK